MSEDDWIDECAMMVEGEGHMLLSDLAFSNWTISLRDRASSSDTMTLSSPTDGTTLR